MPRRSSTLHGIDSAISREIGSNYDLVKAVGANITDISTVAASWNAGEITTLVAMQAILTSLYNDKVTLDSLYADKLTLDSLFTDKATLDSLYADKLTLDSLYADKLVLDSIFADKAAIDSLYADKAQLDSLYADKITLDSIYTDRAALNSLYADKIKLDSLYADKLTLDGLYASKAAVDSLFADKLTLDSLYTDKATLDSIYADKAKLDSIFADKITLDSIYADKVAIDTVYANSANVTTTATNIASVNTVAANDANITTTATNIADVNTIADNITDVTYFADVYQGPKAIEPTLRNDGSALQVGDLYLDTSPLEPQDYSMKTYNGVDWVTAAANAYSRAESDVLHRAVPMKVIAAEPLVKGDLVKWSGYNQGQDAIEVVKTVGQTDICIGVAEETMATNDKGDVIVRGIMEVLNTSAYPEETILYSAGNGAWTHIVPLVSYQAMAYVVKSHASTGAIMINVADGTVRQNLGYTAAPTTGTVTSPDGTDATIPSATTVNAGLMSNVDKTNLDSVNMNAAKQLAALDITDMQYTTGDLTKIVYSGVNNFEDLTYGVDGLDNIAHTINNVLVANTVLTYVGGDLDTVTYTAV